MSDVLSVTRTPVGVLVGTEPADGARAALLEARGALLVWDVAAGGPPSALVHHAPSAVAWLWEVFGADVTAAVLAAEAGEDASFACVPGPSADAARTAALAAWAAAWWPASVPGGIPPLDPRLVALERADALVAVEHLLEEADAATAALADALAVRLADAEPDTAPAAVRDEIGALVERVRDLAEDRGVLPAAPEPVRSAYALAAAGAVPPVPVASGSDPVDPASVPPGTADVVAEARWSVVRTERGENELHVRVDRAPAHPADDRADARADVPLEADLAGARVRLALDAAAYTGTAAVPAAILLTPPERRRLVVRAPGYATGAPLTGRELARIAEGRLRRAAEAGPGALLAERAAGA